MRIQITAGIGAGPTRLAAFDAALRQASIANYNLILLSSVIPPGSEIVQPRPENIDAGGDWGDKLYVVLADERVDTPNTEAWAGIGWAQDEHTGKGLFVEHHGYSRNSVEQDIKDSLEALMKGRGLDMGPINMKVVGITCDRDPVCALAAAVYQPDSWEIQAHADPKANLGRRFSLKRNKD